MLNETVCNSNGNIMIDQISPDNVNDYIYDMIYIKTKKAVNTNVVRNKKFIKKYINNDSNITLTKPQYDSVHESPDSTNVNNVLKNDLNVKNT